MTDATSPDAAAVDAYLAQLRRAAEAAFDAGMDVIAIAGMPIDPNDEEVK